MISMISNNFISAFLFLDGDFANDFSKPAWDNFCYLTENITAFSISNKHLKYYLQQYFTELNWLHVLFM